MKSPWCIVLLAGLAIGASAQLPPPPADPPKPPPPASPDAGEDGSQGPATATPIPVPGQAPVTRPPTVPATTPQPGTQPNSPATRTPGPAVQGPGAQGPGAAGRERAAWVEPSPAQGEVIVLSAFADPVELTSLIEYVATTLQINIVVKQGLTGSVVFNAPVSIPRGKLLDLVQSLLEVHNYSITQQPEGFYIVAPLTDVAMNLGGEVPTTRVFTTPNIRPSAMKTAIESQMGGSAQGPSGSANTGQPAGTAAVVAGKGIAYIDELGVIIATDTPRRLKKLESLIAAMVEQWGDNNFIRIELSHVAAPVARERALAIIGQSAATSGVGVNRQPGVPDPNTGMVQTQGRASTFDNLADRLAVDPTGNALIFRGRKDEENQVRKIIEAIDVENKLRAKSYYVGSAARQIADFSKNRGLGEVTTIEAPNSQQQPMYYDPRFQQQQGHQAVAGGPVMVVDERRGQIIYYATDEMHRQLDELIKQIDPEQEVPVIRTYKLRNQDSEKIADVIMGIIENRPTAGEAPLLPDGTRAPMTAPQPSRNSRNRPVYDAFGNQVGEEGIAINADENVYVLADKSNNQILVKAPGKMQEQFKRLIEKLDLRRPQVYLETRIVAVNWTDELRIAFETQLINANGRGGVLNTNFGLGTFGTTGTITQPKTVATGLSGLTAALIKSDQIPIIMNALSRNVDTRIVSAPSILVDDNEKAVLEAIDEQPTSTTTQTTGNPTQTSFGGYEEAGTKIEIKPQISDGDYLRLKFTAELSSFIGQATNNLPPPRTRNKAELDAVTVPSNTTVIVGGLNFSNLGSTKIKVPLLGDIPLLGLLFSDTNKGDRKTSLYIFLTPRILRDDGFEGQRLLTKGPQSASKTNDNLPVIKPVMIDPIEPPKKAPAPTPATPHDGQPAQGSR